MTPSTLLDDLWLIAELLGHDDLNVSIDEQFLMPVAHTADGQHFTGLTNISHYLTVSRAHTFPVMTRAEAAAVEQWLEYRINYIDGNGYTGCQRRMLEDINDHLLRRSFLAGNKCTMADLIVALGLHQTLRKLTLLEREAYPHLGRWFQLVQQHWNDTKKRNPKVQIFFSKTPL